MGYIGRLALDNKKFDYSADEQLRKALELKLFQDKKDLIDLVLTGVGSEAIEKETREKTDFVATRMREDYGYCDECASKVLRQVSNIFARGDPIEQ